MHAAFDRGSKKKLASTKLRHTIVPEVGDAIAKEHSMRSVREPNENCLRFSVKRYAVHALISLFLCRFPVIAHAQNASHSQPSDSPAATVTHLQPVRNIVLVHGAWVDGSGWRGVSDILIRDGFKVSIVQEPETSFEDDVAAVKRTLAVQNGPSIVRRYRRRISIQPSRVHSRQFAPPS